VEAYAFYSNYIYEILYNEVLLKLLNDIMVLGIHPDRCPVFLRLFLMELLRQKHMFSLSYMPSLPHVASALGDYGTYDTKPTITGKMTVADLAYYEMKERDKDKKKKTP